MTSKTLGETLYDEWIAKEGRVRLTYESGKQLKAVTSVAELAELCTNENSVAFLDDATPMEMIDAWLTLAPAQSDAGSVGELAVAGGPEGCIFIILGAPFVLCGYLFGSIFRILGVDMRGYIQSRPHMLPCFSYVPTLIAGLLLLTSQPDWAMGILLIPAVAAGIIIGLDSRTRFENVAAFAGTLAFFAGAYFAVRLGASFWWIVGFTVAIGTGYGATRSPAEFMAKRPKRVIRHDRR